MRRAAPILWLGLVAAPHAEAGIADSVGLSPRAVALGGSYAARPGDAAATWYNPAGLAPDPDAGAGGRLELSLGAVYAHPAVFATRNDGGDLSLAAPVPDRIKARLHRNDTNVDFLLADAAESKTGEPIYLYQRDVRELQLATGAIRAGINILLKKAGLGPEDLDEVLLAGAFGNFIRRSNARRIGLLPPLPTERIRFVGNAASMGAKALLLSEEQREVSERIAETAEHVDLSLDPEFQMEFGMAMMFPEEDA